MAINQKRLEQARAAMQQRAEALRSKLTGGRQAPVLPPPQMGGAIPRPTTKPINLGPSGKQPPGQPPVLPPPPMQGPLPVGLGQMTPEQAARFGNQLASPGMPAAALAATGPVFEAAKGQPLSPYNTTTQQNIMGAPATMTSPGTPYTESPPGAGLSGQQIRDLLAQVPKTPTSPEMQAQMQRSRDIERVYGQVLGREPDTSGLQFWMNSGYTPEQIRQEMLKSPEYQNKIQAVQQQLALQQQLPLPAQQGQVGLGQMTPEQAALMRNFESYSVPAPTAPAPTAAGIAALPTAPAPAAPAPAPAPSQAAANPVSATLAPQVGQAAAPAPAPAAPNMTKPATPFGGAATFKSGGMVTKVGPRVQAAAKADMAKAGKANTQKGVGLATKGLGKFKVK